MIDFPPVICTQSSIELRVPAAELPQRDPLKITRWVALIGSSVADGITTREALKWTDAREANRLVGPFAGHTVTLLAVKGAAAVAEGWLLDKTARRHSKWANAVAALMTAVSISLAAHNLQVK